MRWRKAAAEPGLNYNRGDSAPAEPLTFGLCTNGRGLFVFERIGLDKRWVDYRDQAIFPPLGTPPAVQSRLGYKISHPM